ncbi:MAG: hypothetical protein ABH826_02945 [Patescibacteria group bacterium]
MSRLDFQFVGSNEVKSIQQKNPEALTIAIGASKFNPVVSAKPREIDDYLELSPYNIFHGIQLQEKSDQKIFEKGWQLVKWFAEEIEAKHINPFSGLTRAQVPEQFFPYVIARAAYEEKIKLQLSRAKVYLVNEIFHVVTIVSTDNILSECYHRLPYNKVDFAIAYNPDWRKINIGANTRSEYLKGCASMSVYADLEDAREKAQSQGKVYPRVRPTLDTISACMLLDGNDLPKLWLEYVESLTLGIFSGRLTKQLPSLKPLSKKLSETDTVEWNGRDGFIGSAYVKGQEQGTSHKIDQIPQIMGEVWASDEFPAKSRNIL